jgi:tetratricopeptide (TPR) repeat protein
MTQHYEDQDLLELPPDHPHVQSCASCSSAVAQLHELSASLADESLWAEETPLIDTPVLPTVVTLRAIATQMDAEDLDASRHVALLLSAPRPAWLTSVAEHPEWRTPGFVRKLIEETDRLIDSGPADVVEITAVAVEVADHLDARGWHGDTVPRLRAAAWRERAYALYYVGRHVEALAAADRAATYIAYVAIAEFDAARLMLVRALILRELERYEEALVTATSVVGTFRMFGDITRTNYAVMFESTIAYAARDYRRAVPLFEYLATHARERGDLRTLATVQQNVACCYRELRQFDRALESFGEAVTLFDQLGMDAERVRARWHIGRVLLSEAKYQDAALILRTVKDTYARLEIGDKSAIAAIDLAEASLMQGSLSDVIDSCRYATSFYERSGLAYSQNAMTALALLREAVDAGRATTADVNRVRTYLERLPRQPALLFAQLPE